MNLLHTFAQHGLRVFSLPDALPLLTGEGISDSYAVKLLNVMAKRGDLQRLGNGLYALPSHLLSGGALHVFEIAMKLVKVGAISHRSAMFYHDMTDQILNRVYITSPRIVGANQSTKSTYVINHTDFSIKRVQECHYYGVKRVFIGEVCIWMTDLEKTLIDALNDPHLCGGFREVLHAFTQKSATINPETMLNYLKKEPVVTGKRVGWILEHMNVLPALKEELLNVPTQTIQKLDSRGLRRGSVNKRWMLMENI